eukprot:360592-Pelagomonas_calceolata.AAC.3
MACLCLCRKSDPKDKKSRAVVWKASPQREPNGAAANLPRRPEHGRLVSGASLRRVGKQGIEVASHGPRMSCVIIHTTPAL